MDKQRVSVNIEKPILEVIDTLRQDAPRSDFFNYILAFYIQEHKEMLLLTPKELSKLGFFNRRFSFNDDEILTIGVVLTQFIEYRGGSGNAYDAQCVLDKLGKDLSRIYTNKSRRLQRSLNADMSTVVR